MAEKSPIAGLARPPGENIGPSMEGRDHRKLHRASSQKEIRAWELLATISQEKTQVILKTEFGTGLSHDIINRLTKEVRGDSKSVNPGYQQEDFCIEKIKQYRAAHPNRVTAGPRRVHYWVVSKLPLEQRMILSTNGKLVEYCHTKYWVSVMSHKLADARIHGRIPWDWVADDKNPELVCNKGLQHVRGRISAVTSLEVNELNLPDIELPNWEDATDIKAWPYVTPARFTHQTHYLIVVIEKELDDPGLRQLADKYGADWQAFTGMFSVTRVKDAREEAQKRGAQDALKTPAKGLPVCVFYISDLDPAGYTMARAYKKRMQQIYPHPDHKMIRVGITREQMLSLQLPIGLSKKKYDEEEWKQYETETGGGNVPSWTP